MKEVTIYTDGACRGNPGPGGWACVLEYNGKTKELSGFEDITTNNRMEIRAALEGLKALKEPCRVHLYTDSQYLHKAIVDDWLGLWMRRNWCTMSGSPVLNQDLWLELIEQLRIHTVSCSWVKGHSHNEMNNRCDALAGNEIDKVYPNGVPPEKMPGRTAIMETQKRKKQEAASRRQASKKKNKSRHSSR